MKKYFMGIMAIVMAVTVVAFTPHKKNKRTDPYLYYFSYDANSVAGETNPANYTWLPSGPTTECEIGALHCVINANKNGSDEPILMSGDTPVFVEISTKLQQ